LSQLVKLLLRYSTFFFFPQLMATHLGFVTSWICCMQVWTTRKEYLVVSCRAKLSKNRYSNSDNIIIFDSHISRVWLQLKVPFHAY